MRKRVRGRHSDSVCASHDSDPATVLGTATQYTRDAAEVGNIGHFDNEMDMAGLENFPGIKIDNIKPQALPAVHPFSRRLGAPRSSVQTLGKGISRFWRHQSSFELVLCTDKCCGGSATIVSDSDGLIFWHRL